MKLLAALLAMLSLLLVSADVQERKPNPKPALEAPRDLSGYYQFAGVDKGEAYEGVVRVIASPAPPTYRVLWLADGGNTFEGTGYDDGERFCVGWSVAVGSHPAAGVVMKHGVNVYRIQEGGKLSGRWTAGNSVQPENWELLKR